MNIPRMRFARFAVGLLCVCVSVLTVVAQTPPREDDQEWNEVQLTKPLTAKSDLILTGQLRFGRKVTHIVEEQLAATFAFKPNRYLTLNSGYSYMSQQPYAGRMINQHRLIFSATNRFTWHNFTLTERNQIEQRFVVGNRDSLVYRQRLMVEHPAHFGSFKFKPFIWDEIRYSSQKLTAGSRLGWHRNRLALGISKPVTPQLTLDFFYLRQHDGIARPGNIHAGGITVRISLPSYKSAAKTHS